MRGTYVTTIDDGTVVNGSVTCVGMDQPDGGIFAIHLTCDASDEQGAYSLVYGCNYLGDPGPNTALGCIGGIEAEGGDADGQRGGLTMHWYSAEKAVGTGQWYTSE